MYILSSPRLIFLANLRTASQSIVRWLGENFEVRQSNSFPTYPLMYGEHHGVDLREMEHLIDRRRYEVFSVVRNHWDWVVSVAMKAGVLPQGEVMPHFLEKWIEDKRDGLAAHPFLDQSFVEERERRPKHAFWLYGGMSDHVFKLEDDLGEKLFALTTGVVGESVLPVIDAIPRAAPVADYYTELAKEMVYTMFRPEIDEYEYEFPKLSNKVLDRLDDAVKMSKTKVEPHWSGAEAVVVMPKPKPLTLDELEDQAIYADVEALVAKDEVLKPKPKRRPTPKAVKKAVAKKKDD